MIIYILCISCYQVVHSFMYLFLVYCLLSLIYVLIYVFHHSASSISYVFIYRCIIYSFLQPSFGICYLFVMYLLCIAVFLSVSVSSLVSFCFPLRSLWNLLWNSLWGIPAGDLLLGSHGISHGVPFLLHGNSQCVLFLCIEICW